MREDIDCKFCQNHKEGDTLYDSADRDGGIGFDYIWDIKFCPLCGHKLRSEEDEKPTNDEDKKDCSTCYYLRYNDHWGRNMCYDPDPTGMGCVGWSHWTPS